MYFILPLVLVNLTTFQWIFLVKCFLPLYSEPEEGAKEKIVHSQGDTLLVGSCALPLAVCLESCTPLSHRHIVSNNPPKTDLKYNAFELQNYFLFSSG